ncbi:MAG TPA: patatin-like phospholipase family protein [Bacteroidales bacterium]|nr:patatin-like phospholipase family protein [Bacteroidales bacterium]
MKRSAALVLSAGGSRGLAQIGAVGKLEEYGFRISSVAGSSIGSIVGGLYAMGRLKEYSEWVRTLDKKAVWGLIDFTLKTSGLIKGDRVLEKMKTFIPDMDIEKMNIPFAAVATDILNERDFVFRQGSFYNAVRASIAIPGIFTSVKHEDTVLVDGGVLSPVPAEHVVRKKNDILIVVNLYGDRDGELIKPRQKRIHHNTLLNKIYKHTGSDDTRNPGYVSLLRSCSSAMIHKIVKLNIEKYKPEILINIPCDSANTFDFYKADKLIAIGADAAKKAIDQYLVKKEK